MTDRIYRHVITLVVLSEEETLPDDIQAIAGSIVTGDNTGEWDVETEELSGLDARKAVEDVRSDPDIFGLVYHWRRPNGLTGCGSTSTLTTTDWDDVECEDCHIGDDPEDLIGDPRFANLEGEDPDE